MHTPKWKTHTFKGYKSLCTFFFNVFSFTRTLVAAHASSKCHPLYWKCMKPAAWWINGFLKTPIKSSDILHGPKALNNQIMMRLHLSCHRRWLKPNELQPDSGLSMEQALLFELMKAGGPFVTSHVVFHHVITLPQCPTLRHACSKAEDYEKYTRY